MVNAGELPPAIWSGVYESFEAAGPVESGHINPVWISKSIEQLRQEVELAGLGPMSSLGLVLSGYSPGTVRVLDVGGNLGALSLRAGRQIPELDIDYTVLDISAFVKHPEILGHLLPSVTYCDSTSDLEGSSFDVAYFGSVIQYFSDWQEHISKLVPSDNTPDFLVFDDLMIGPQPSFVSVQKYYDDAMTMWFLNETEFCDFVVSLGYRLRYRSEFRVEGKRYFPPLSLPPGFRIPFAQTAIFERQGSQGR